MRAIEYMKSLTRFIVFIGPCSSIFDYTTYFMMLYIFHCWNITTPLAAAKSASLFQTGWFVESLLTQTIIIHIIRTKKIPFLQSRPSWPLMVMSVCIMAVGIALPLTRLGAYLGFTALPPLYWPLLALTLLCYVPADPGGEDVAGAAQMDLNEGGGRSRVISERRLVAGLIVRQSLSCSVCQVARGRCA
jgi:magnesium-transporting ATPase (P-type)